MYLAIFIVGIFGYKKLIKSENYKYGEKVAKIAVIAFCSLFILILSLVASQFISSDIKTYNDTYKKYKNGDYKEVEGYVRNFKIKQDEDLGSDDEEFDINGVHFKVYAGEPWPYWYSPSVNGGGIINHDGQYVRVKFETYKYPNGKERNYIMEIYVPVNEE